MIKSINDVITLNNGVKIPQHGFGVYLIKEEEEGYNSINKALEVGYRSFDTAQLYENEKLLGKILSESGVKRSDLFITTKVADFNQGYDGTLRSVEQSLKDLKLDQIDLLLIHWPSKKHFFETWNALEKLYDEKLVRAIGVSNYEIHHLEELSSKSAIKPVINQVECHTYLTQEPLKDYLKDQSIAFEAWSPLGRGAILNDNVINKIANKYDKSIAQIVIRWHLQKGNIVIPKSSTPSRIEENANVYDFNLADDEIKVIDSLNKNQRNGNAPDDVYLKI
ncbi:aldo/keto reductase [Clostridium chromiireducens]|uniref:Aldo/keto reductase n=1 Tax=Clostridium chromiireducens TaxID=225345 RepID=A0A964RQF7_9CLOT|nr:aldo/keto reductase [Clostridium chromiireducens]MVX65790.1 aldo/keto reductase [Clostridium chromiireducens]